MGVMVIAVFHPRPGMDHALEQVVADHLSTLRRLGLATNRPRNVLRAKDGTILEVFEWVSPEAIDKAHAHPDVLAMWKKFDAACTYGRLADLKESADMFPGFATVDVGP